MRVTKSHTDDKVIIRVQGDFNFSIQREFRDSYASEPPNAVVELDMGGVRLLDSSALGMLLLMRQHFGEDKARVSLVNPPPAIRKILEVAHFNSFFPIR